MRQTYWILMLFLVMAGINCSVSDVKASDQFHAQDLVGLSQEDRAAVMKSFLERRMDKLRNIELASETRIYNREFFNGKLGARVADSGWFKFNTWHCDGSYRLKSSWFVSQDTTVQDSTAISHYDEKTGTIRIVSKSVNNKRHEGRIGLTHLPTILCNRVSFHLLSGSYVMEAAFDKCDFLLQSLAECSDKWHIDVNVQEQEVVISHPHRISFFDTGTGTRKIHFDVTKGMLPVRIDIDFRDVLVTSKEPRHTEPFWFEDRIVMNEAKNYGGFWMSSRIEERRRCSVGPPNVCSIMLTNVKRIVFGNVKKEDLEFKFPPDTEVADTIKNVFYRTGSDGEPTGPINPIGIPDGPITLDENGQLVPVPKQNWMLSVGLWSLGIGIALFFCLILLRRIRASSSN